MKIYHNAACSKSRAAHAQLSAKYDNLEVFNYLETLPNDGTLRDLIARSDLDPENFVRWDDSRKLGIEVDDKNNLDEVVALLVKFPKLLQRPIVDTGDRVVICRNEDALASI